MGDIILDTGVGFNKPITCDWNDIKNKHINLLNKIQTELIIYKDNKENETIIGYNNSLENLNKELKQFGDKISEFSGKILSSDDDYTLYLEYNYFLISKSTILDNLKSNINVLKMTKEL